MNNRLYLSFVIGAIVLFLPACLYQEPKKTITTMKYEELKKRKEEFAKANDTDTVILYLQKMVPLCQDLQELRLILIELADLLFDQGKLIEAEKLYREYSKLYPSDPNAEYTLYKAILCCFYKTLDPTRDQTKTHETLALSEKFLERRNIFTQYSNDVEKIVAACNEKLAQTELNIITFYTKRGKYRSAQHRIDLFKKEWLEKMPRMEVTLIHQEYQLALAQNNRESYVEKHKLLQEKFPQHPLTLALGSIHTNDRRSILRRL